ncbi:polysaccharide biosynthesis protein [Pseudoflavonifractor capillosus]|uniref:oligosaccharide flippase family protein n=1 Tax=Pseudoflavonifractor capillosus TaxID=106588 RepID=UPI00195616D2|nr:oligosaccharide flippase family protein [Pseudoflavonifractor capillosus]MBM6693281.1 polysaccharide biosynthesis protein [Pseudoflavonifractor capillosus]
MRLKNNSQIKSGAIISYAGIVISTVASLLYTPWMKDQIGDANYGLYTLVGSLVAIFMMDFGLSTSVTRFISKYRAENNEMQINNVMGYVFKLYIAIDVVISIVLIIVYLLIDNIYVGLSISERDTLKKLFLIFATYSVLAFPFTPLSGVLNAYEKFVWLKICELFQKLFAIFLTVVALLTDHGVVALVLMNAVSGIATILIKLWIIGKEKMIRPNVWIRDKVLLRELFGFSIWVTVLALAQRLIFNIAPSILGVTSTSIEIARFAPASQLEGYFFTFAYAINGLFMPMVARLDYNMDNRGIENIMIKVGKYQICVLGLLFAGICTVGTEFIELWMGSEYRISGICTVLLIAPSIFLYPQQIANTLLSIRNKVKYQAMSALIMGVINVGLSFVLTPQLGALGSSISICVAFLVNLVLLNVVYHKVLHLNLKQFYKVVYIRYVPPMVLAIIITQFILRFIPYSSWLWLLVKIAVCTTVYLMLLFMIGFSKEGKAQIISVIRTRLGK